MKKQPKHLFSRLLAVALAAVMLLGAPFAALAAPEEYEYTDPYVLTYEGSDAIDAAYQEYCKPYLYASPHLSSMDIRNLETGRMEGWYCSQQVYNMIDTTAIARGGTGAYASLEVYCVDACISAGGGSSYRRVNLEDATHFDDVAAGRIRAIFLNSFPYIKDISVIAAQVNSWLEEQGGEYTAVSGLTAAEVVTATQYTIWVVANGDDVKGKSPYTYTDDYTAEELAEEAVYITNEYMDCTEDARETTANNIRMVQKYLESLTPVAPQKSVASDALLVIDSFSKKLQEDGTYNVTVNYSVKAELGAGDELTLTATHGTTHKNVELTAANLTGTIEVDGVKADENISLEINGYQTGGDVYLFEATGGRAASQSMAGYDASSLPVHAETSVNSADHILQIYKTTGADDGKKPLANIEFEIYQVASMAQIASGEVVLSEEPTASEISIYKTAERLVATIKTDAAGFASYNLTQQGQSDGVYMIVEKPNAAVVAAIEPFFVAIPGTSADGSGIVNVVKVQPKNTVETGPVIKKDVTEIENDHDTFDVDEVHTWIIRGGVPAGIGEAKTYVIKDTLDWRLTYRGNIVLRVGKVTDLAQAEEVVLTAEEDYTVSAGTTTDKDGHTVDTFIVSLTETGMKNVAAAVAKGTGKPADYEVRVYFDAVIDTDAGMGEKIPNQAFLEYTNSAGIEYDAESDIPEVHTGGLNILKVDSKENDPLAGASFQIARDATEDELADSSVVKQTLTVDGSEHQVVFVDFHATADLTGEKVFEVTTGADGKAVIYGLAYGEYYIVETKAPAGYNLLGTPVVASVDDDSHTEEQVISIINTKFVLPETGGVGTTVFTMLGAVLITAGAVFVVMFARKKREQA